MKNFFMMAVRVPGSLTFASVLRAQREEIVSSFEFHLLDRLFCVLAAGDLVEEGWVALAVLLLREEVSAALERAQDVRLGALTRPAHQRAHPPDVKFHEIQLSHGLGVSSSRAPSSSRSHAGWKQHRTLFLAPE